MKVQLCDGPHTGEFVEVPANLAVGETVDIPGHGDHEGYVVTSILGAIDGVEYARAHSVAPELRAIA